MFFVTCFLRLSLHVSEDSHMPSFYTAAWYSVLEMVRTPYKQSLFHWIVNFSQMFCYYKQ